MGCVGELMGNSLIEDSKVYCYNRGGVIQGRELQNVWESFCLSLLFKLPSYVHIFIFRPSVHVMTLCLVSCTCFLTLAGLVLCTCGLTPGYL